MNQESFSHQNNSGVPSSSKGHHSSYGNAKHHNKRVYFNNDVSIGNEGKEGTCSGPSNGIALLAPANTTRIDRQTRQTDRQTDGLQTQNRLLPLIVVLFIFSGLFQRAILMSGSAFSNWALVEDPVQYAGKLASHLNCTIPR